MKTVGVGLATLLVSAAGLSIAAPAQANPHDERRCVSQAELWHTPGGLSRAKLERRWEVRGKGEWTDVPAFGRAWVYPMCGSRMAFAQFKPGRGLFNAGDLRLNAD